MKKYEQRAFVVPVKMQDGRLVEPTFGEPDEWQLVSTLLIERGEDGLSVMYFFQRDVE